MDYAGESLSLDKTEMLGPSAPLSLTIGDTTPFIMNAPADVLTGWRRDLTRPIVIIVVVLLFLVVLFAAWMQH